MRLAGASILTGQRVRAPDPGKIVTQLSAGNPNADDCNRVPHLRTWPDGRPSIYDDRPFTP